MVLTARLDESALGPDASLFVGVDDLVGPRDRCCDIVHFSRVQSAGLRHATAPTSPVSETTVVITRS